MQDIVLLTSAPTIKIQPATQASPPVAPPSLRASGYIAGDRVSLSSTRSNQLPTYPTAA